MVEPVETPARHDDGAHEGAVVVVLVTKRCFDAVHGKFVG